MHVCQTSLNKNIKIYIIRKFTREINNSIYLSHPNFKNPTIIDFCSHLSMILDINIDVLNNPVKILLGWILNTYIQLCTKGYYTLGKNKLQLVYKISIKKMKHLKNNKKMLVNISIDPEWGRSIIALKKKNGTKHLKN